MCDDVLSIVSIEYVERRERKADRNSIRSCHKTWSRQNNEGPSTRPWPLCDTRSCIV